MMTVVSSASARPNFVKLAAVHHALARREGVKHIIVHTGQHYDPLLSDIFFEQLEIPEPDENLGIKGGASREEVIQLTSDAMKPVLKLVHPDILLVYGDVNGAVGAARAAADLHIRIGHVEAGLRSRDTAMPEELNRIEIDGLADELFVTEESAFEHIQTEKLKGNIHFVGNTMIDTLIRMTPAIDAAKMPLTLPEHFAVATLHRPSNVDDRDGLLEIIKFFAAVNEKVPIVLPIHPRFRDVLAKPDAEQPRMNPLLSISYPIDPLGYIPFLKLMKSADFILTDSGGIQEEAAFLGKRCFTLRRNTERPSTIESGSNVLIDPSHEKDRQNVLDFAQHPRNVEIKIPEKWDGQAGERIADIITG